jgi:hypothetical protein
LFGNRLLRNVFVATGEEEPRDWRMLDKAKFLDPFFSINKSRIMRWAENVARMEQKQNAYGTFRETSKKRHLL